MKDFSAKYPARECKLFWVVHNFNVYRVQGISCAPNLPNMWWFPEVGDSAIENQHAFEDELSAWLKVLKDVEEQHRLYAERITKIAENIARLNVGLPSRTFGGTEKERSAPRNANQISHQKQRRPKDCSLGLSLWR